MGMLNVETGILKKVLKQTYMTQQFHTWESTQDKLNIYPHKDIYRSVIHNSPKLELVQMSVKWWMYKQNVLY